MVSITGTVTLGNLHRFGEQPNYLLNISVSDGVFTSFASLQVDLLSTNRHSPVFSRPLYEVEMMENLPAGTLVAQLNATDADRDDFGRIIYSILSASALEVFKIDEETGDVSTRRPLDRELRKVYEIPVVAFDAGGKSGHATLRVKVGDVNDNRPRFLLAEYRANIHANFSVGQPFLKVIKTVEFSKHERHLTPVCFVFRSKRLTKTWTTMPKSVTRFTNQMGPERQRLSTSIHLLASSF